MLGQLDAHPRGAGTQRPDAFRLPQRRGLRRRRGQRDDAKRDDQQPDDEERLLQRTTRRAPRYRAWNHLSARLASVTPCDELAWMIR